MGHSAIPEKFRLLRQHFLRPFSAVGQKSISNMIKIYWSWGGGDELPIFFMAEV
jgi:hypothetical protein